MLLKLKDFLKLVPEHELINLYIPSRNVYVQLETIKLDYDRSYENYIVFGVETNLTNGYNSVLELNIEENM